MSAGEERDRAWRREAIARARLLAIVGESRRGRDPLRVAEQAIAGGARFLELRLKGRPPGEVAAAARALAALCARTGALLVVNDDAGAAAASGADGVHVGQEDLPPTAARRAVGPEAIVGLSVHDLAEAAGAVAAARAGAIDYAGVGTFFASATKPHLAARPAAELEAVARALASAGLPCYAIGGIDASSAAAALAAGVHGVAVGSAIADADDPEAATRAIVAAIDRAQALSPSSPGSPRASSGSPGRATPPECP